MFQTARTQKIVPTLSSDTVCFSDEKERRIDHIGESTRQRANTYEQTSDENNLAVKLSYARIQRPDVANSPTKEEKKNFFPVISVLVSTWQSIRAAD